MEVLARALKIGFGAEIGDVDHQRIAFPMAARIAVPLADIGRQVRRPVHDDVALPPLSLAHIVEYCDSARRLNDPAKAPAEIGAEFWQAAGQAALRKRCILRTVNPV